MKIRELIELLNTCDPDGTVKVCVPDKFEACFEDVYQIAKVNTAWADQACTSKPNRITMVVTDDYTTSPIFGGDAKS